MTIITSEQKLADVVLRNYTLIPVVNRFGIELGFGDKTIEAICAEHKIDAAFFVTLLNTISIESYYSNEKLKMANTMQLIDYLKKTLENYKHSEINVIEIHINQLRDSCPEENIHLQLIENFFIQFRHEFRQYVDDITRNLFEVVAGIFQQASSRQSENPPHELPDFAGFQHTCMQLNEKLSDMKSLLIKYLTGKFDRRIRNAIIFIISRFEQDIHNYMRLQYRLLKPMTQEMLILIHATK
jgi:regulator of cell morphogenesis and NO signaling